MIAKATYLAGYRRIDQGRTHRARQLAINSPLPQEAVTPGHVLARLVQGETVPGSWVPPGDRIPGWHCEQCGTADLVIIASVVPESSFFGVIQPLLDGTMYKTHQCKFNKDTLKWESI